MTDDNVIDVEAVEDDPAATTAAIVHQPVPKGGLMRPVATTEATVVAFHEYQAMCEQLLVPADHTRTWDGKTFKNKSAWRKLATAMNVSVIADDIIRLDTDDYGRVTYVIVRVIAEAPNGRTMPGIGACDSHERCCPKAFGEKCNNTAKKHTHCDAGCTGFAHFSKAQHDIPATAETRAKNRALSDLFGFGEVSAEEVGTNHGGSGQQQEDEPADAQTIGLIAQALNNIADNDERTMLKIKFKDQFGVPSDLMTSQLEAAKRWLNANGHPIPDSDPKPEPTAAPGDNAAGADESGGGAADPGQSPAPAAASPESPPADSPAGDEAGASTAERSAPRPPSTPGAPPTPSTAQQRRSIGMKERELREQKNLLREGDKAELVAILTHERVSSTVDTTQEEATRIIACLALIDTDDLEVVDDPEGGRAIAPRTARGTTFLRSHGLVPSDG